MLALDFVAEGYGMVCWGKGWSAGVVDFAGNGGGVCPARMAVTGLSFPDDVAVYVNSPGFVAHEVESRGEPSG